MVEFCEKCGGLMRPSKEGEQNFLVCKSCENKVPVNKKVKESYTSSKKINHPVGEEFKNLEKMEDWKEKEIYKKFKDSN
jgi:DNA-directed RNA polymerase subunit M/transcription elongation factor TFIIS